MAWRGWNGVPLFWRAQILGWGLFAAVDLVNQQLLYHSLPITLVRTAIVAAGLMAFSAAMRVVYAPPRFENRLTVPAAALAAALSLGGATLIATALYSVRELAGWPARNGNGVDDFVLPLTHYVLALLGWCLCFFWIRAERAEQAEHHHALRAELEELRLQLDPHFLFNALNGVAEEIPEHPTAALAMLRDLTAYLRHSLDGIHQTVVTVEAEVSGLAAYLRVQQARFGDRLRIALRADPVASSRLIASFLLQPLVENAVKHGRRDNGLDIRIDIAVAEKGLRIEIENTGTLDNAPSRHRRPGIGLENVRRRLALHYPGRHGFTLAGHGEGKVLATLLLEGEPCSEP